MRLLINYKSKNKSPNFDSTHYLAINLQYLESPQYLRKALFPIHPDLKNAGLYYIFIIIKMKLLFIRDHEPN